MGDGLDRLKVYSPRLLEPAFAMTTRSRSTLALLGCTAALSLLPLTALAQGQPGPERLSPQQRQQIFPEQKALWLRQERLRLRALRTAEGCVSRSSTAEAFQQCLRQERQAHRQLKRSHWSEMARLLARYGLPLPERPAAGRAGQGGPMGPAGCRQSGGPPEV